MINIPALIDLHKDAEKHLYLFEYVMCAVLKIESPKQGLKLQNFVNYIIV